MTGLNTMPGNLAPNFTLQNHEGEWLSLHDFTSKNSLLLAFYPGDFTLVCTKQLCAYQGTYPEPLMNQYGVMKKFLEC